MQRSTPEFKPALGGASARPPLRLAGQPVAAVNRVAAALLAVGGRQDETCLYAALEERTSAVAARLSVLIARRTGVISAEPDGTGGLIYVLCGEA